MWLHQNARYILILYSSLLFRSVRSSVTRSGLTYYSIVPNLVFYNMQWHETKGIQNKIYFNAIHLESAKYNVTDNSFEFRTFLRAGPSDLLISLNTEIFTLDVGYESYKSFVAQEVEGLVKCAYYTLPRYQFVWKRDGSARYMIPPV